VPLNQLASFPGLVSFFVCIDCSPVREGSNSAASSRETGSGEIDRSLLSLRKGKNVGDREGELDRLEGKTEAKSVVVLDRLCDFHGRVAVGGGTVICKSSLGVLFIDER
jgi:hypothetical protein